LKCLAGEGIDCPTKAQGEIRGWGEVPRRAPASRPPHRQFVFTPPKALQAARARWKIENVTINTLKTKGDHLEHNFGYAARGITKVMPTA